MRNNRDESQVPLARIRFYDAEAANPHDGTGKRTAGTRYMSDIPWKRP